MHVAFIDTVNWQYTLDTPLERPFGGAQSALCYLAAELRHLGHAVTVVNGGATTCVSHGVRICHLSEILSAPFFRDIDAVVVLSAAMGEMLRRVAGPAIPLVLWVHHSHDQPAVERLRHREELAAWTGLAFVSNWQRDNFERSFKVPHDRGTVLRNAVSPPFIAATAPDPWFLTGRPPVFYYSSAPYRGLDVLLSAFPRIRAAVPEVRLRIFSSLGVYQVASEADEFAGLYDRCRATPGVEYVGSIGQARLAAEIAGSAALTYPSTFAETSCIAALEAMSAGAAVITTQLGALPETTAGFARILAPQSGPSSLAQAYSDLVIAVVCDIRRDPELAQMGRVEQMRFIRESYTWPQRALEWETYLGKLAGR